MKKSNYIFNFQEFMKKLRNDEEKMEIVREYEAACGEIKDSTLEEMPFYKDYLAKFPINEDLLAHIMFLRTQGNILITICSFALWLVLMRLTSC